MLDLIEIGRFGVKNAQTLLNTTANNANNVDTKGYIRKSTQTYTSTIDWGVGETYTTRVYDQFVQRQMFTDKGQEGYYDAYKTGMSNVDQMLSDEAMAMATSLNSFFDSLEDSIQNPTDVAGREDVLSELDVMTNRYKTYAENIYAEIKANNDKADDTVTSVNRYLEAIEKTNHQIRSMSADTNSYRPGTNNNEIYLQLLDQRDELINDLSSLLDINVIPQADNCICVYMRHGQLLANGDTYAHFSLEDNPLDSTRKDVYLSFVNESGSAHDQTKIKMTYDNLGGKLGGYLTGTDEIRQSLRDLGQLAASFADAVNVQNRAGFTLENVAGRDLLAFDTVRGASNDLNYGVICNFGERRGADYPSQDFKIEIDQVGQMKVFSVDPAARKTELTAGTDYVASFDANGNLQLDMDRWGITLNFDHVGGVGAATPGNMAGTEFLVQPTLNLCATVEKTISKPEDLAYASAVRPTTGTVVPGYTYPATSINQNDPSVGGSVTGTNTGNAVMSLFSMSATGTDMGVSVNGTTNLPQFNAGAPAVVVYQDHATAAGGGTVNGNFLVIYDNQGNELGYTKAENNTQLFANAVWSDATTAAAVAADGRYPGYEVAVKGTLVYGDTFNLEINTNGIADNSNGLTMGALRTTNRMPTSGMNKCTFNEGCANLTAWLGSKMHAANTSYEAAAAKCDQTKKLYDSVAGVNLDEEAANLLMYQKTYTACAKIIEASQTVFNALIGAF